MRYSTQPAKETVKEDKGKWKAWREKNLKVSEETERLYRRLADAIAKKEDVFVKCKSIRDAIKHLSGLDENLNPKPAPKPRTTRSGSTATGLQPPETDTHSSGGLEAELENAGADEIIANIQDDADKLEEIAKASIAKLAPDKVCDALTEVWNVEQLIDLQHRLVDFINAQQKAKEDSGRDVRRGFAQPLTN